MPAVSPDPAPSRDGFLHKLGAAALGNVSSFGVDAAGELFVINYAAGAVRRILPGIPPGAPTNLRVR